MDIEQEFCATPDDFGEGQLMRSGELFGPAIEIVRELDLGLYHEGKSREPSFLCQLASIAITTNRAVDFVEDCVSAFVRFGDEGYMI
jgi:hypothetical protein